MASVRILKKGIFNVVSEIIDAIYIHEMTCGGVTEQTDALLEESFGVYDDLMSDINAKNIENKKAHFKAIQEKLETSVTQLVDKINAL